MKKALLVTNSEQSAALLKQLLREEGYDDISVFFAAYSAREEDDVYDLICINAPLPDENGIQLAKYFADTTRAAVVIIVPKNGSDEISDVLNGKGVLVIAKPIQRHLFHHYLLFADCFRSRLLRLERENEKLKHMVEDLKIIDRAKLLLVTCLNMSEEQAHRYLEKQAMDLRTSRLNVAKQVIRTYEN
ncbi:MAG: ANTAR domain-containing protein [Ruminococcus sp.]|nr:ANTAR domain-containing protein [Ruminococcus sp.]